MFERFTDEGRSVIVWAQEETVSLRHSQIGTEHVLLGVLRTADPLLQGAFRAAGVTASSVRDRLVEMVGRGRKGPTGHIPFTQGAKHVLERSLRASNHLGGTEVGPAHLLVAILQAPDCTAARVLLGLDVDIAGLAAAAERVASSNSGQAGLAEPDLDQPAQQIAGTRSGWAEGVGKIVAERTELAVGLVRFARHEPGCEPAQGCSCGLASLLVVARSVLARGR